MGMQLFVCMYHYTRDLKRSRFPKIKGLDAELFSRQLDYFREKFNVVSMPEVINAWNYGIPLPERAMLLTFDDGYLDNYTVAFPLLRERGMTASFFVPGKVIEKRCLLEVNKIHLILASSSNDKQLMNEVLKEMDLCRSNGIALAPNEDLIMLYAKSNRFDTAEVVFVKRVLQTGIPDCARFYITDRLFKKYVNISEEVCAKEFYVDRTQMQVMKENGMFFGIHGYEHNWLGNLSSEEAEKDIQLSMNAMGSLVEKDQLVINYPYGSYNDTVIKFLSNNGFQLGLTTQIGTTEICEKNRFKVSRFDCNDFPPVSKNFMKYL